MNLEKEVQLQPVFWEKLNRSLPGASREAISLKLHYQELRHVDYTYPQCFFCSLPVKLSLISKTKVDKKWHI